MMRQSALTGMLWIGTLTLLAAGCAEESGNQADSTADSTAESTDTANPDTLIPSEAHPGIPAVSVPDGPIRLVQMPPSETGIDFRHVSGDSEDKPFPAANGSGAGALDFDLDGLIDLYFATGATFPLETTDRSPSNRMFRNRGDWTFRDVTEACGLGYRGYSVGIAAGDVDDDGFPDVYVTCFGENRLFLNLGDGTFAQREMVPGGDFSTSAAWLDYDTDGLLDLYVGNYGNWTWETNQYCGDRSRNVRIFCSPNSLDAEPDRLLQNLGDGTFRDVTAETGVSESVGRAQGVLAADINADGQIDLYIGNDIHPNFLFLNDGNGHFRDVTESTGTAYDRNGQMQAGMGVASADVNRDGQFDLFVTNFEHEYNTLYLQTSAEAFYDSSLTHGLAPDSKPWVGWGTAFVDFDLDGWKDLIVCNGHVDNNLKEMGRDSPYEQPGLVWKNEAGRFRFLGASAGAYFRTGHPARGLVTADLDNDGDTDVVITQQDQSPALLRNDSPAVSTPPAASVTLRLIGRISNRDAIGSRIVLASEAPPRMEQIQSGGSYVSSHDLRLAVAVEDSVPASIEIIWPSGLRSVVQNLEAFASYDLIEPEQDGVDSPVRKYQSVILPGKPNHD